MVVQVVYLYIHNSGAGGGHGPHSSCRFAIIRTISQQMAVKYLEEGVLFLMHTKVSDWLVVNLVP